MSAIQILPVIVYDPALVAVSIIAPWRRPLRHCGWRFTCATAALADGDQQADGGTGHGRGHQRHALPAAASRFSPDAFCVGSVPIDSQWLGVVVGLIANGAAHDRPGAAAFDAHRSREPRPKAQRLQELNGTAAAGGEGTGSEERLKISDNIPAMLAYWDRDGICRFASSGALRRFGLTPEQLVGMSMEDVIAFGRQQQAHRENLRARSRRARKGAPAVRSSSVGRGHRASLAGGILAGLERRRGDGILCADRRYHTTQNR